MLTRFEFFKTVLATVLAFLGIKSSAGAAMSKKEEIPIYFLSKSFALRNPLIATLLLEKYRYEEDKTRYGFILFGPGVPSGKTFVAEHNFLNGGTYIKQPLYYGDYQGTEIVRAWYDEAKDIPFSEMVADSIR